MSGIGGIGGAGAIGSTDAATDTGAATDGAGLRSDALAGAPGLDAVLSGSDRLGVGARGDGVRSIQSALIALGHDLGRWGADGSFGRATEGAVAAFQRSAGLVASGRVDRETLLALDGRLAPPPADPRPAPTDPRPGIPSVPPPDPAPVPTPAPGASGLKSPRFQADPALAEVAAGGSLARGAKGDAVKRVQLALAELGHDLGRWGADADYGGATESAVRSFQRQAGLPVTGILDAGTLRGLDGAVATRDAAAARPVRANALDSGRFSDDATLRQVASGGQTLGSGAKGEAVERVQWTLLGLGYELPRFGADGDFGGETTAALQAFQRAEGLAETGTLDATTLHRLDDRAVERLSALEALRLPPEEKAMRFRVVTDLVKNRVYVLERGTDKPVASYLTSPGTPQHPTIGDHFTLKRTVVMGTWYPPSSPWAAGLSPIGPGLDNPMGILKLDFGRYAQYFHGIPAGEERHLGQRASHGCLRMSGANVLEFHERFAGPGTDVVLTRDAAESRRLAEAFAAAGIQDRPTTAGREYTAAYYYGETGINERLESNGTVSRGGRGG